MSLRILLIGGTQFVGRHIAQQALARGHALTLFNRGRTNAGLFAQAEQLRGDRAGDLSALGTRDWDAVIDTCGYTRKPVAAMCRALAGRVKRYVFISSVSVYKSFAAPNDESSPTGAIDDADTDTIDGETYGPLKALCEDEVRSAFGARALIIRPGLIAGPHDPTDRYTYWVARIARARDGDEVLAPESPAAPIQYIDARDLAGWILHCIEQQISGTFNAVCPPGLHTLGKLLAACQTSAGVACKLTWASPEFLQAHAVAPWTELPLWLPMHDADGAHFMRTRCDAAQAAGLQCRPLRDTVQATYDWLMQLPDDRRARLKAGLAPHRERALLHAWRESQTANGTRR